MQRQFNSVNPTFANIKTSIDSLEDEVSFLNVGHFTTKNYMQLSMGPNE